MRGSLGVESEVRVESEEQLSLVPAQVGLAGAPLTGARNRTHLAALAGRASYLAHLSDSRSGSPLLVS
jgi:hypothetical protein